MSSQQPNPEVDFFEAMQDVKPLKQNDKIETSRPQTTLAQQLKRAALEKSFDKDRNYLSVEKVEPLDPYDVLEYKKDGVQEGVYRNLRLGKYQVDSVLSLQRMKLDDAREVLFDTVMESHKRGIRTLLIQHGLGLNSRPFPALVKSYVNQWLRQMPEVLAFHSALKQQGGLRSVYVLLKKNNQQKLANREAHQRRQK